MNVAVSIRTIHIPEALRAHVQRRLQFSIARFANRLGDVSIRIGHTEGASGERVYVCRAEAEVRPPGGTVLEEVADRDLYTAIDLTADRIGRALRRALDRDDGKAGHHGGRRVLERRIPEPVEEAMAQGVGAQPVGQEGER